LLSANSPQHWSLPRRLSQTPPALLSPWLLDRGSLTARLIQASNNRFRVELLQQSWRSPRQDESKALGLPCRNHALIREVLLYGDQQPWVYARSVLPAKSLAGPLRYLKRLGTKPLGALLFNDPNMQRDEIEIACLQAEQLPSLPNTVMPVEGAVWGRRSMFYLSQQPLLVSEVFLPEFLQHLQTPH